MIARYMGLGALAVFGLMLWGLNHYKSKSENLEDDLKTEKTLTKTQSAQIKSLAEANKQSKAAIDELEFINLQWSKQLEQTKQQFEQAKVKQAQEIQSIRSKYDEARKNSNDVDIVSNDVIELRQSACRYCDQDPYSRGIGADNVPD